MNRFIYTILMYLSLPFAVLRILIKDGKKSLAQNIVCDALDIIAYKTDSDPIEVFEKAVKKLNTIAFLPDSIFSISDAFLFIYVE